MKHFLINLKTVKCSQCGFVQNYFRFPKNWRQFLWGGYTCTNCGSEIDKFGNLIKKTNSEK